MPDITLSERKHPLYTDNEAIWIALYDSVIGGEKFMENNIFSHRLEDTGDLEERLKRAYYLNFCLSIPNVYNSYIFKERTERPADTDLSFFRKNADGRGLPIEDFVKMAGFFSSVFGVMHALVDVMPSAKTNKSKRDERLGEGMPYATLIFPTQIIDWSVDDFGELNWIIISDTYFRDSDPNIEREEEEHYKLITRDDWKIQDQDGNPAKLDEGIPNSGTNELGMVPLVTLFHKNMTGEEMIGDSLIKDIFYINRTILNWCSCIDEQIERQTFSQLVVPDDGSMSEKDEQGDDPLREVGTSSVWTFPSDSSQSPKFISPDVSSIEIIWKLVLDHIKEIYRISGLLGGTGDLYASRSGKASQIGFQGANSALAEKSTSYQLFENNLNKMVYRYLNKNVEDVEEVKYPASFDVAALGDEIDSYFKIMEKNFSPTLNKEIMKNIARRTTTLTTETTKSEIENEIESGDGMILPEVSIREIRQAENDVGNPNTEKLEDTNRGADDKEKDQKKVAKDDRD